MAASFILSAYRAKAQILLSISVNHLRGLLESFSMDNNPAPFCYAAIFHPHKD